MGSAMGKGGNNFFETLHIQGTVHLVMLGLDSAGKTTALYRLKFDQYLNTAPTIGFNCEKVQGSLGKSKGIQFVIWDVGGQEKLRPLWRSYTRCTDGILFVVDSVDIERMEEAKMELFKTARCPDNQGVPVLILANKQDLPGARDSKELEKLLGLNELTYSIAEQRIKSCSASNIGDSSKISSNLDVVTYGKSNHSKNEDSSNKPETILTASASNSIDHEDPEKIPASKCVGATKSTTNLFNNQYKSWYIQPTCAITGEGLQEGIEALYNMILKRRKLNKAVKKKR